MEMSTPCCCFRNKADSQSGSAPAGTTGFGAGGGTLHGLFHRVNQGPLLEKAKQIFPNKNRSREMRSVHHEVFYICCDLFLLHSAHDPPVQPLSFPEVFLTRRVVRPHCSGSPQPCRTGSPHRLAAGRLCSPPAASTRKQAERQCRGTGPWSFVPSSREEGRSFPWAAVCFRSLCSQRGIY